nr:discoidin domain-containing protein [Pirellulaceae bacterium]
VVAYPVKPAPVADRVSCEVSAGSSRLEQPPVFASDGLPDTFWVSYGVQSGEGPTRQRPEWLQFRFREPVSVSGFAVQGRPGYGPTEGELQASDDGAAWQQVQEFSAAGDRAEGKFEAVRAAQFRLMFYGSRDPRFPASPRNVQIVEAQLLDPAGHMLNAVGPQRRPLQMWAQKALHKPLSFSAPDTTPLLQELPPEAGEEDTAAADVRDLTACLDAGGTLRWDAPKGEWEILRFGCTLNDHCRVSTCSDGWDGYALDPFDAGAFRKYWEQVVEPLIADAGPLAGTALKYLHTDSWEVEVANWTPTLREEFRQRRGYDLMPFLPVIAGRIVDSRPISNRFLHDFRKTMGDLAVDNHYRLFSDGARRHNLRLHPESGGPHAVPVDSLRCLGMNDAPMSEFWAWSWRHRIGDTNRFFVKQPASAAHTYGRRLVLAEGFTTIGPHWQETLWDNLKPAFDQALCEGLNRLVWHAFTCSPAEMGLPGQEYFAGTHFNPNSTWWHKSPAFLAYLNRCQYLLQQGTFVADAVSYYGDHVPNFAQLKRSDPARVLPGYDYDVATEEVVLTRMSVRDGRIVLPDGMSYRVLVLPDQPAISLPVLRKVQELVDAGATVIGPKPIQATGLHDYPACDAQVAELAGGLWGADAPQAVGERRVGQGRVVWGKTAREVLSGDGVLPDFEVTGGDEQSLLDYIHRRDGDREIYFVANRNNRDERVACTFRVAGKVPELFDPLTGRTRPLPVYAVDAGRTTIPLQFAPCGSWFIVFRQPAASPPATAGSNFPVLTPAHTLSGSWQVRFEPRWGGPETVEFAELTDWTKRPEDGIRFYSGTATYRQTFALPDSLRAPARQLVLDLGAVKQLAQVKLNGRDLGVLWAFPFRVDVTDAVQPTGNVLDIEVVNFWPNRVIGDQALPEEQRLTRTNIRKLTKDTPLVESGLLGPVQIFSVTAE